MRWGDRLESRPRFCRRLPAAYNAAMSRRPPIGAVIPGIVGILLADRYLKCTASGVELQREARELKAGAFPSFWKLLSDPERATPVIFISPRLHGSEPELLIDPQELADSLGHSAFVYFTKDRGFVTEMRATIPAYSYRCSNGTVCAYATHPQVD